MNHAAVPKLDFAWAESRWRDPLTGAEVVCLSPDRKRHFRNNYFRCNMFTGDGRLVEVQGTAEGEPFSVDQLSQLVTVGWRAAQQVMEAQRAVLADRLDALGLELPS